MYRSKYIDIYAIYTILIKILLSQKITLISPFFVSFLREAFGNFSAWLFLLPYVMVPHWLASE